MKYVKKRGRKYHYVRRIPKEIKKIDGRTFIQISLKTDSQDIAQQRALLLDQYVQAHWHSLINDGTPLDNHYQQSILLNKINGMQYRSAAEIANQELSEIVKRSSLASQCTDEALSKALLGGFNKPELTLSQALEKFWDLSKDKLLGKSEHQVRKWKNPRIRAISNFINIVDDKPLDQITRDDVLNFKDWWLLRIENDGLNPASANRDFTHVRSLMQIISDNLRLDLSVQKLFERTSLRMQSASTRLSFTPEFTQNVLLNKQALEGINPEYWLFICAMADTGARINELTGLDAKVGEIVLDADIPHIIIRPNDIRKLKTPQSERTLPLVGSALFAFQQMPNGFENYASRPDSLSSALNKWFRDNEALPTLNHSLYSLRHCFQDRLTAIEAPDKVQAELMGHKFYRPKYGAGSTLEQRHRWLSKIAFKI